MYFLWFLFIMLKKREEERIISFLYFSVERVYMFILHQIHDTCIVTLVQRYSYNKHIVDVCVCSKSTIIKFVIPKKHDSDISLKRNLHSGIFRFSFSSCIWLVLFFLFFSLFSISPF